MSNKLNYKVNLKCCSFSKDKLIKISRFAINVVRFCLFMLSVQHPHVIPLYWKNSLLINYHERFTCTADLATKRTICDIIKTKLYKHVQIDTIMRMRPSKFANCIIQIEFDLFDNALLCMTLKYE